MVHFFIASPCIAYGDKSSAIAEMAAHCYTSRIFAVKWWYDFNKLFLSMA